MYLVTVAYGQMSKSDNVRSILCASLHITTYSSYIVLILTLTVI